MPTVPQRFVVEVEFLSGGVRFAAETHAVDAVDWTAAKRAAFRQADDSIYDNDRIPDLTRRAIDRTTGDPAPVR
ncbi:hypothetical protein AWL63_18260 [Sphingomonas panacis]|uniref:Uncharacterized protein n=2 Tax=Sphingomonas panacis TaxID=1560345 RepID=A0A1B3ZHM1_9SPHN|nr:hypothetical protein AWL63_18260 [Sphingomonas panacis]